MHAYLTKLIDLDTINVDANGQYEQALVVDVMFCHEGVAAAPNTESDAWQRGAEHVVVDIATSNAENDSGAGVTFDLFTFSTASSAVTADGACIHIVAESAPLEYAPGVSYAFTTLTITAGPGTSSSANRRRRSSSDSDSDRDRRSAEWALYTPRSPSMVAVRTTAAAGQVLQENMGSQATLRDVTPPSFRDCPQEPVVAWVGDGELGMQVYWTEPLATDNVAVINSQSTHMPGQYFTLKDSPYTVVYEAWDLYQSTQCEFEVQVAFAPTAAELTFTTQVDTPPTVQRVSLLNIAKQQQAVVPDAACFAINSGMNFGWCDISASMMTMNSPRAWPRPWM